jgi:hypothetical protein
LSRLSIIFLQALYLPIWYPAIKYTKAHNAKKATNNITNILDRLKNCPASGVAEPGVS